MSITQISKIQIRTGNISDLPQLDVGELGFATDTRRLFIGNDPAIIPPPVSGPNVTEILTSGAAGTAAGANMEVQYNVGGLLGASSNLKFNYSNQTLCTQNLTVSGTTCLGSVANVKISGGSSGQFLSTNGTGTLSWTTPASGVTSLNSLNGAITLAAGTNVTLGTSGSTITINSSSSGVTSLNSLTGGVTLAAGTNISLNTVGNTVTINGSEVNTVKNTYETVNTLTGATGVVVHDFSLGSIFNHTSIAANFTVNITNLNLNPGYATNLVLILNQGASAYISNALQIAGAAQTIRWQGGSLPTGNPNAKDAVSFSITNVGGTYTVFGQLVSFS